MILYDSNEVIAFNLNCFGRISRRYRVDQLEMKVSGKVKFFDSTKGFGFITPDDGGTDVFVHQTEIHAEGFRSLAEGEPVEFDLAENPANGRTYASNVSGPNGAYVQGAPRRDPRSDSRDGMY